MFNQNYRSCPWLMTFKLTIFTADLGVITNGRHQRGLSAHFGSFELVTSTYVLSILVIWTTSHKRYAFYSFRFLLAIKLFSVWLLCHAGIDRLALPWSWNFLVLSSNSKTTLKTCGFIEYTWLKQSSQIADVTELLLICSVSLSYYNSSQKMSHAWLHCCIAETAVQFLMKPDFLKFLFS